MTKEKVTFIGTTPKHLTRATKEREFAQFIENNNKLLKAIRAINNRSQNFLVITNKAHE